MLALQRTIELLVRVLLFSFPFSMIQHLPVLPLVLVGVFPQFILILMLLKLIFPSVFKLIFTAFLSLVTAITTASLLR